MGKSKKEPVSEVATRLTKPIPRIPPTPPQDYLSCGVTPLNLAATGHIDRFIQKGTYVYFVGDSGSSKTWMAFMMMAEASINSHFNKHQLIFDNAENGSLMDVRKFFGPAVEKRMRAPRYDKEKQPENSRTVQEMFYNIDTALDAGPCIYIVDSIDALNADEDETKFEEDKSAFEKGKDTKGSYGMAKAKYISKSINRVAMRLRDTGSILFLISQTRDKVGGHIPGLKTRSGGKALKFYAHLEIWTSLRGVITKGAMGKEREIGNWIQFDIQKNRLSGWEGKLTVPFYRQHGFSDIDSCVEWLCEEHWVTKSVKGKGTIITAPEFNFEGSAEVLVRLIEESSREEELRLLVFTIWQMIEESCLLKRRSKYS